MAEVSWFNGEISFEGRIPRHFARLQSTLSLRERRDVNSQTQKSGPHSRQRARISILEKGQDFFSDFTPKVEEFRRGFGTGQNPNLHGVGFEIGDLKGEHAMIPQF